VAAEDVGCRQFGRHMFLAGVNDLGVRHHSLNLGDMTGLDGIAKDDSHSHGFRWKG
jgi:hypothetical protein